MRRRQLLGLLGVSTVSVSGCLGSGMPDDAVIRAVSDTQASTEETVQYRDLPEDEQNVAETAVNEEFYHVCPEIPDAVQSFANRFDDPDSAYLTYQDSVYALWIRITDVVLASTASSPDANPSCGLI